MLQMLQCNAFFSPRKSGVKMGKGSKGLVIVFFEGFVLYWA